MRSGEQSESVPHADAGIDILTRTVRGVISLPQAAMNKTADWLSGVTSGIAKGASLQERIEKLESQLDEQFSQTDEILRLQSEVDRLRSLSEFPDRPGFKTVYADIVSFLPRERRLILNIGRSSGVLPGSPVVTSKGLVGQVVEASSGECFVNLVSHPLFGAGASVTRQDVDKSGIVRGRGSSTLAVTVYELSPELQNGDLLVTSGLSKVYPEGLEIGTVVEWIADDSAGLVNGTVVPAVDPYTLREVIVLTR